MSGDVLVLNPDGMPLGFVPLSTTTWDEAIKNCYTGDLNVLHVYEDWEVHSPSVTIKVPSVVMVKEYVGVGRRMKFCKQNVYLRDRYTCAYCLERFAPSMLTWDHVLPRAKGGKTVWTNLVACCSPCNGLKGHHSEMKPAWKPWEPTYFQLLDIKKEEVLDIREPVWNFYIGWPEDRIRVVPPSRQR